MKGIDCTAQITPELARLLKASGIDFVCRYLVPSGMAWKRLGRPEAETVTSAGLHILSVFESSANRASSAEAGGCEDGKSALAEAKAVGQPEGSAIYFAVDYDAQQKDYGAIHAYLTGARSQIPGYEVGVYGSYAVCEEMHKRGIKFLWQTYAWSKGRKSAHANVYQYKNNDSLFGIACDLNESYGEEGFWRGESAVYKETLLKPVPGTVKSGCCGDDVKYLQQELKLMGFDCGAADGVFGPRTDRAVRAYQKACGLAPDGIAGPRTWTEILKVYTVELSPDMLKAALVSSAGPEIAGSFKSFINANFFTGKSTIGWLISEGQILTRRDEYKTWHGNPKGTLTIHKDGRVEVGPKLDSELASTADAIRFCCQGFNLPAAGDVPEDIRGEGFDPDTVGCCCNRLAVGYDGRQIVIAVRKFSDAVRMRHTMELLGCAGRSICLDSGGSTNLWVEGRAIFKTDRALTNIVCW